MNMYYLTILYKVYKFKNVKRHYLRENRKEKSVRGRWPQLLGVKFGHLGLGQRTKLTHKGFVP